jgi:predicted dehydrogenase/NADPH:quinone reductase-like Zn-dependent oxidoreductase
MRQIICNLKTGDTYIEDVPAPSIEPGHVLIATRRTLVSQGTERMLVEFGKASLFQKAKTQPDKVKQVIGKIRTDGFLPTVEAVFRKLDKPLPLGYCNSGVVIGVGCGVTGVKLGDRVASNGPHAEVVSVPQNLVARIPENVSDDAASFTAIGAIALQGVRLAKPELGETFVVVGLGVIGQIAAQLLVAHGCHVIGFDFDPTKVELARTFGIEAMTAGDEKDVVKEVIRLTGGMGCDGVIIAASTQSNQVIAQAAQMSRKRGRIILIGVVGLDINRADFYEKELTFQVSCSYGPGRYDEIYEEKGMDYPFAFVRWTENRNFQAVLNAMGRGFLRVEPIISRRVTIANFAEVYANMNGGGLASLLVFDGAIDPTQSLSSDGAESMVPPPTSIAAATVKLREWNPDSSNGAIAVIGAGNFTQMTVLPALFRAKSITKVIVSSTGVSGTALAKKYAIPFSSTDYAMVLEDRDVKGVLITTRHNLHAAQTIAALSTGKCVLVEKPLCLTGSELKLIERACNQAPGGAWVSVGFNRRFSPHAEKMKRLLGSSSAPVSLVATMNAGSVPLNHWVHDPEVGGGRLLGEACHFVDLAIFLTGSLVEAVSALTVGGESDCASILLRHANGSISVVNYLANGNRDLSKERVEVHSDGRSLLLDNFRELRGFGFRSFTSMKTKQDKGHSRQFALFSERVRTGGPSLIPWTEIANSARATLAIPLAIAERRWIAVSEI